MTLSSPVSASAVIALADAIFSKSPLIVVETDSFDEEPKRLATAADFCKYAEAQKCATHGSVDIAVLYPDMGGQLTQTRRDFEPGNSSGLSYGISVGGWGLIRVHLDLRGGRPLGSWISANSQKRAEKWSATYPEFGPPTAWNWGAVASHERRLSRLLKKFA